jgi:Xaa-Pro aminopeptidase
MDVLIVGETGRTPELRHEVPLTILDPFVYVEADGRRIVAISGMEAPRIDALGTDLETRPFQEFGADELRRSGLDEYAFMNELTLRVVRALGVGHAVVPRSFPVGVADVLRAGGVELAVDQSLFDERRRSKSEHELAGIRRAQRASEEALTAAVDLLRRSEPRDGGRVVDGSSLTCELLKERIQNVLVANGAFAGEIIASHGPQTAIGHDNGSGPIAEDDVVLVDLFPVDLESACFADMTRTFALGAVSEELQEAHRLCKEALDLAVAHVRPGANGADLHRQACDLFAEHGHPTTATKKEGEVLRDGFNHALGHGVGLAEHESPWIGTIGEDLAAGDVIALEPALYRNGVGGIRIEDLILVTNDGCELLSQFPYDFIVAD